MNHWRVAIETHATNFPNTQHDCADIQATDPRRYPSADCLITSPECTNHSIAKGVSRKFQNTHTIFGELTVDPAAERSRATMWDVPRFAEVHKYKIIIVENVVDARKWVLWDAWLHAMHNLGYLHKCVYLNSRHAHPTPQSRDRMYVVFWRKGNKAPNLDIRPQAHCPKCDRDVDSVQTWKDARKKWGKYKQQYLYACPSCGTIVEPYYYAAFNCIDWSIQGTKIGEYKRPLSANTMRRIRYGLERFGNEHLVIYGDHSSVVGRVHPVSREMFTQTTTQTAALLMLPTFVTSRYGSGIAHRVRGNTDVLPTQSTGNTYYVLGTPFMVNNFGTSTASQLSDPVGAQTTINSYGLVSNAALSGFLTYYYGHGGATSLQASINTVSTVNHTALILTPPENVDINECTYRMIRTNEVQRAMAFEDDYIVCGTNEQKIVQLGNAVTPPAMEVLVDRCVQSLL
jgi:DNA (cytosine-5)-methyltransferase 1